MGLNSLGVGFVFSAKDFASQTIGKIGGAFQGLSRQAKSAMAEVGASLNVARLGFRTLNAGIGALDKLASLGDNAKELNLGLKEMEFFARGTAEEMEAMNHAVFDASVSAKGFNANEAALAMGRLANYTNDAKKSMELLSPTLTLMRISGMEAAEAARYLTSTLATLGLQGKDASRVNDLLVFGARNFGLSVRGAAEGLAALKDGVALTKTSMEDAFIAFGLMSKGGKDAASAAGAVAEIMNRIADPKVGLGLVKITDTMAMIPGGTAAAKGGFRSVLDVLDTVYARYSGLSDRTQALRIRQTFKGASDGVLSALRVLKEGVKDVNGTTYQGAHAIAYLRQEAQKRGASEEMAKKFTSAGKIIEAALTNIKIAIGKPFADALKPFAEAMGRVIQRVVKFIMGIPAPVKQGVATFLLLASAAVAAFGAFIVLKAALGLIWFGLGLIAKAAVGALIAFAPLLIKFAIAIAVFEAFRMAYEKNFGGFRDFVDGVVKKVQLLWDGFIQAFNDGGFSGGVRDELRKAENLGLRQFIVDVYAFVTRVRALWGGLSFAFQTAMEAAQPTFDAFRNSLMFLARALGIFSDTSTKASVTTATFTSVGRAIGTVLAFIVEGLVQAATRIIDVVGGVVAGARVAFGVFRPAFEHLGEAIKPLWEALKGLFGTLGQVFGIAGSGGNELRGFGVIIGSVVATAVSLLAEVLSWVIKFATHLVREITELASALIAVGKFAVDVGQTLVDLFLNPRKVLAEFATGLKVLLAPAFTWLLGIVETVRAAFDQLLVHLGRIASRIPERFRPAALNGLIQAGANAQDRIGDRVLARTRAEEAAGSASFPATPTGAPAVARPGPVPTVPINFTPASAALQSLPANAQAQGAGLASFTPEDFAKAVGKELQSQPVQVAVESKIDKDKVASALVEVSRDGKRREAISSTF